MGWSYFSTSYRNRPELLSLPSHSKILETVHSRELKELGKIAVSNDRSYLIWVGVSLGVGTNPNGSVIVTVASLSVLGEATVSLKSLAK